MSRALIAIMLGALICAGSTFAEPEKDKPAPKPKENGSRGEKIDGKADRTLTGVVETIDAKDQKTGTLKMCSSGQPKTSTYHYTFRINDKTKFLTAEGKPLPDGLKSQRLTRAEIMVEFVDREPKNDKPAAPEVHVARKVQLIKSGK